MPDFDHLVTQYASWMPLFIFLARVADVSMGTVRTLFIVRGMRLKASLIGFVEVGIWVIAISSVVRQLDHPFNIVAYSGGFAIGNWVGMWFESKLAIGQQIVRVISRERGQDIADTLRRSGVAVTEVPGSGRDGPVTICFMATPRKEVDRVIQSAIRVDSEVFITVEDTRLSNGQPDCDASRPKTGWRAVLKKK
ncbi:MAG: DUF2179 domain-containing protein [bacterium]|nr:DUF2179 domain-containing protein [bacterium]